MLGIIRLIVGGLRWLFGGRQRKANLQQSGVNASAQVLSVQDTGSSVNGNPRVVITARVTPDDGGEPFDVSNKQLVSRVAIPRAGDTVTVRYVPDDHSNCAISVNA
ncbi:MAG TPA: DUF3592 domain-containing protein [Solirubrobacteraceae bacterium]|jgi:hypothetical protein|nr:DUF3592 domain-containing protein [Solirubrobacteraceae bacterium]